MNSIPCSILRIGIGLALADRSFGAAAPPNDDFINRIHVEGGDVLLQAVMEGSTLERMRDPGSGQVVSESSINALEFSCSGSPAYLARGSVWWTWTAPRSGTVVILPESEAELGSGVASPPGLTCFLPADLNAPGLIFRLGQSESAVDFAQRTSSAPRYPFAGFQAIQGSAYLLQVRGCDTGSYTFRLLMPGGPHISEQPLDKTLVLGESSFLHVTATGAPLEPNLYLQPLRYQWLHGEVPIEGQTYSTLPLLSVTTNDAGAYRVVITDHEGTVTSAVARVVVNLKESPPRLIVSPNPRGRGGLQGNPATWVIHGEAGRYYVMESSSNLVHWQRQSIDAVSPLEDEPLTVTTAVDPGERPSHVRVRQEPFEFQVATVAKAMFLRARRVQPVDQVRSTALWILQYVKEDWGRDPRWRRLLTDYPTEVDLAYRIHSDLRPSLFGGENECHAHVVMGTLGSPPVWPCVPFDPSLWDLEAYSMVNPRWVWNPAR